MAGMEAFSMVNNGSHNNKWAFTLVELLVVIAIIVLLFALLMPALSRVRKYSTTTICMSYLHAYTVIGSLYLSDNNGFFPQRPDEWLYTDAANSDAHPIGCRWHDRALGPESEIMQTRTKYRGRMWAYSYFDNSAIHPCPLFRDIARHKGCENPAHRKDIDIVPQYNFTMNAYLGSTREGGVLKESDVRDPANVFFFAEENSWSVPGKARGLVEKIKPVPLSTKALDDTVLTISPSPQASDCFATYHNTSSDDLNNGSGNVAFVDGHIESIRAEDQLRKNMHNGNSRLGPAGNLFWAWASKSPPPCGWDKQ